MDMYYDQERGTIALPSSNAAPIKGPLTKCVLPCAVTCSDKVRMVFGLPRNAVNPLVESKSLYCDSNAILCRQGLSRCFAGVECDESGLHLDHDMVLNQKVYRFIEGDNLLTLPDEVLVVEQEQKEGEIRDAATIEKLLMKHVKNEEYVPFVMDKLQVSAGAGGNDKGSVFRTVTGSSLTGLSKSM